MKRLVQRDKTEGSRCLVAEQPGQVKSLPNLDGLPGLEARAVPTGGQALGKGLKPVLFPVGDHAVVVGPAHHVVGLGDEQQGADGGLDGHEGAVFLQHAVGILVGVKIRLGVQQLAVAVVQGPIAGDGIGNAAYVVIQGVLVQRENLPAVLRHLLAEDPEKVETLDHLQQEHGDQKQKDHHFLQFSDGEQLFHRKASLPPESGGRNRPSVFAPGLFQMDLQDFCHN